MEFLEYWNILRKRWWLIGLLLLAGGAGAAYYGQQQAPLYRSTTTLFLNPAAASPLLPYQSAQTVESLANTYAEYMRTNSFAGLVAKESQLAITDQQAALALSTEFVADTQFFRITATHVDPQTAQVLANTAAQSLIAENVARLQAEREQLDAQHNPAKDRERQRLEELRAALEEELALYTKQLAELQRQITELQGASSPSEAAAARLQALQSELIRLQSLRVDALSGLAQTEATLSRSGDNTPSRGDTAVVVDKATLPAAPLPRRIVERTLMALAVSLALGAGLAFLLEYLDYTIKNPAALERVYGASAQGVIGMVARKGGKARRDQFLVALRDPRSPVAEAFRALRTSIRVADLNTPLHSLLITSASPNEGKTFVAANLAISLARNGSRVILVDTDLRKPSLHEVFELPREPGFTNLVVSQQASRLAAMRPQLRAIYERASNHEALRLRYGNPSRNLDVAFLEGFLHDVETDDPEALRWIDDARRIMAQRDDPTGFLQRTEVEHLWVLTAGVIPPNPAELLGSPRAAQVMEQLADYADIVIYDSPPAMSVTDATVIAPRIDAVLQVVQAGGPRIDLVRRCKSFLDRVGARVLGPVLNQARSADLGAYYAYGDYRADEKGQTGAGRPGGWHLRHSKKTVIANGAPVEVEPLKQSRQ